MQNLTGNRWIGEAMRDAMSEIERKRTQFRRGME
jgi:hypothetical protein